MNRDDIKKLFCLDNPKNKITVCDVNGNTVEFFWIEKWEQWFWFNLGTNESDLTHTLLFVLAPQLEIREGTLLCQHKSKSASNKDSLFILDYHGAKINMTNDLDMLYLKNPKNGLFLLM